MPISVWGWYKTQIWVFRVWFVVTLPWWLCLIGWFAFIVCFVRLGWCGLLVLDRFDCFVGLVWIWWVCFGLSVVLVGRCGWIWVWCFVVWCFVIWCDLGLLIVFGFIVVNCGYWLVFI